MRGIDNLNGFDDLNGLNNLRGFNDIGGDIYADDTPAEKILIDEATGKKYRAKEFSIDAVKRYLHSTLHGKDAKIVVLEEINGNI